MTRFGGRTSRNGSKRRAEKARTGVSEESGIRKWEIENSKGNQQREGQWYNRRSKSIIITSHLILPLILASTCVIARMTVSCRKSRCLCVSVLLFLRITMFLKDLTVIIKRICPRISSFHASSQLRCLSFLPVLKTPRCVSSIRTVQHQYPPTPQRYDISFFQYVKLKRKVKTTKITNHNSCSKVLAFFLQCQTVAPDELHRWHH